MNQDFQALHLLSAIDGLVEVTSFNDDMAIVLGSGPVLITKAQAMKFFNLVEAPQSADDVA